MAVSRRELTEASMSGLIFRIVHLGQTKQMGSLIGYSTVVATLPLPPILDYLGSLGVLCTLFILATE